MTFIINVLKCLLNVIYLFFKLFKKRKQITFISRQGNSPSIDFLLLENELKSKYFDYKIVMLCKKMDNKILYLLHMFKQMYHISRSKLVVLDSYCIAISILKHKKGLKVVQIWHAIGLMKKAGYASVGKEEGRSIKTSNLMNMHKNYTHVFVSSENCIKSMSEVFGCDEKIIHSVPLPRIDLLKNEQYINKKIKDILKEYPKLKSKVNVLYAPTFRKDEKEMQKKVNDLCNEFDFSKYNLIIKLHPLSEIEIQNKNPIFAKEYTTTDMIYVSDYVISDYSSVIYEAGILKRKLLFYSFDLDDYKENRDFFINYKEEIPGPICQDAKEIVNYLKKYEHNKYKNKNLVSKYVDLSIKNYTNNMVNELIKIIETEA